jgi:hypothetical protein
MNYETEHPRPKIILGQVTFKNNDASKRHRIHLYDEVVPMVFGRISQSQSSTSVKSFN